jgi:omega-6 fatty acid desaturase (delta-12 desaturase)
MSQVQKLSPQPPDAAVERKIQLARYREPSIWKSGWQLFSSITLFCVLWTVMLFSLQYSYWLTLLLSVPTAGLMVRLFILQHDCGHGAFFKSKRLNDVIGFALGVLVLTPYGCWRRFHALHHATAGDLDRRGFGDVHMITVEEYLKLTRLKRFVYRLWRNPVIQFGILPLLHFAVMQRLTYGIPHSWKRERASVYWTNALVFAVGLFTVWLVGPWQFFLVHAPVMFLASSAGVWLFFVQHNFETAYWQRHDHWEFELAGIEGSSYYELPRGLQWLTANIGFHHIHHLDSRIPNYRLQECFDQNSEFQHVHRLTLWQSLSCVSLKLFDEEQGRMVGFRDLAAIRSRLAGAADHPPLRDLQPRTRKVG